MKDARRTLADVESILVQKVASLLPGRFQREGTTLDVHAEVVVGANIADLVLVARPPRRTIGFSRPLTVGESVLLAFLRSEGVAPIASVESLLGVRPGGLSANPSFRWLERRHAVRVSANTVKADKAWSRRVHIVAIEAKLTRWRDALTQAATYRKYADRVFVALPERSAGNAFRHAEDFRTLGVGLLQVTNREVRTLIAGTIQRQHDWRREFVASRLLPRFISKPK
jgi:hypothetical protein